GGLPVRRAPAQRHADFAPAGPPRAGLPRRSARRSSPRPPRPPTTPHALSGYLLFLGGVGAGRLGTGVSEQSGGTAVGKLLEGFVDLWLQLSEGSGVFGEQFGPLLLPLGQRRLDLLKGLLQGRDLVARFRPKTELHGWPLGSSRPRDTPAILSGGASSDATIWECTLMALTLEVLRQFRRRCRPPQELAEGNFKCIKAKEARRGRGRQRGFAGTRGMPLRCGRSRANLLP